MESRIHSILTNLGLLVVLPVFLVGSWSAEANAQQPQRPNFVIIMADDLGYGDLSCYWNDSPAQTPNLDRMAAEGIRFTDFHSSGNVCSPTRAGLVTGRYQQRAGVPGVINADPAVAAHHTGIENKEITFAELLKDAGYKTAIMGKWHLGYKARYNPVLHGFETFRGYISGNIDYISHFDRMETYDWWNGQKKIEEEGYVTHLVTKHSVDFIHKNKDKPFCLYVAHEAVHAPWQGPNDPPVRGPNKKKVKTTTTKIALPKMLTEMDKGIGEILKAVKDAGVEDNTLVMFFSDNGPAGGSAGPLRGRKGSNWEGGHRVPAIARWPGKIAAGIKTDQMAISLDIMPTILSMAKVDLPAGHELDGVDLTETLTKKTEAFSRKLYWNSVAARDGNWKLMLGGKGVKKKAVGLYDLSKDIGEKVNLAAKYPERVKQMRADLAAWTKDVTPTEE